MGKLINCIIGWITLVLVLGILCIKNVILLDFTWDLPFDKDEIIFGERVLKDMGLKK